MCVKVIWDAPKIRAHVSRCCAPKSVLRRRCSAAFGGQDSLVDKALDYRPKDTGFDPRLDPQRRSTWATKSFSMWDNKDLLIIFRKKNASPAWYSYAFEQNTPNASWLAAVLNVKRLCIRVCIRVRSDGVASRPWLRRLSFWNHPACT
jgi:hypothetical protein